MQILLYCHNTKESLNEYKMHNIDKIQALQCVSYIIQSNTTSNSAVQINQTFAPFKLTRVQHHQSRLKDITV